MLAKMQWLNNVLAAYFYKICIRLDASQFSIYHSAGCQLDANCIRLAASRIQNIKIYQYFALGWGPAI